MAVYISNAFSLQMQGDNECVTRRATLEWAKEACVTKNTPNIFSGDEPESSVFVALSCIGHADIAAVLSELTGYTIPVNRVSVSLQPGDKVVVGQYVGPRLPEGCKTLPEGARIDWYIVEVLKPGRHYQLTTREHKFREFVHPDTETGALVHTNAVLHRAAGDVFPEFSFIE